MSCAKFLQWATVTPNKELRHTPKMSTPQPNNELRHTSNELPYATPQQWATPRLQWASPHPNNEFATPQQWVTPHPNNELRHTPTTSYATPQQWLRHISYAIPLMSYRTPHPSNELRHTSNELRYTPHPNKLHHNATPCQWKLHFSMEVQKEYPWSWSNNSFFQICYPTVHYFRSVIQA